MSKEFYILTKEEEKELTKQELREYYIRLRDYLSKRSLTNTAKSATIVGPKLKKITAEFVNKNLKKISSQDITLTCDGLENIPDERVLFAYLSQQPLDRFIWLSQINRYCLFYSKESENKLVSLAQHNIGLISYKNKDKIDYNNAKMDMIRLLLEGNSIIYFVEDISNLSLEQLHFYTNYEFLEIAQKAGVPIIPVVHNYNYDNSQKNVTAIHSSYGEPIYVSELDDLSEKIVEYENQISAMRSKLSEKENHIKVKSLNK